PIEEWIAGTGVAGRAAHRRPPVVATGHDQIHLVVAAVREEIRRAMLGLVQRAGVRVPCDALHVAVPERPHRRPGGGIVRRDRTIFVQPEDLPREDGQVLCVRAVFGVAAGHVELAVGPELEATAVVRVIAGDPVEDDGLLCPKSVLVAHANDLVSSHTVRRPIAVVEVDEPVLREVGVENDPEQPLLAIAAGARRKGGPRVRTKPTARAELNDPHATRALGDKEPPIRREVDRPRRAQSRRDELHVLDDRRPDARRGGRARARSRGRRGRRDRNRCQAGRRRRRWPSGARDKEESNDGRGAAGDTRGHVEQRRGLLSEQPLAGGPSRSHEGPSEEDPGAAHAPKTGPDPRRSYAIVRREPPATHLVVWEASELQRNSLERQRSRARRCGPRWPRPPRRPRWSQGPARE